MDCVWTPWQFFLPVDGMVWVSLTEGFMDTVPRDKSNRGREGSRIRRGRKERRKKIRQKISVPAPSRTAVLSWKTVASFGVCRFGNKGMRER